MLTGLPTLLGWDYHVKQRGNPESEIETRKNVVRTIYSHTEAGARDRATSSATGVGYVYVGPARAQDVPAGGPAEVPDEPAAVPARVREPRGPDLPRRGRARRRTCSFPSQETLPQSYGLRAARRRAGGEARGGRRGLGRSPLGEAPRAARRRRRRTRPRLGRGFRQLAPARLRPRGGSLGGWGGRGSGEFGFRELCGVAIARRRPLRRGHLERTRPRVHRRRPPARLGRRALRPARHRRRPERTGLGHGHRKPPGRQLRPAPRRSAHRRKEGRKTGRVREPHRDRGVAPAARSTSPTRETAGSRSCSRTAPSPACSRSRAGAKTWSPASPSTPTARSGPPIPATASVLALDPAGEVKTRDLHGRERAQARKPDGARNRRERPYPLRRQLGLEHGLEDSTGGRGGSRRSARQGGDALNETAAAELADGRRRISGRLAAALLLFAALAVASRFWALGDRPLHHDESIHAYQSWTLSRGGDWRYDPAYHGPFLYYLNALVYKLFGATDATARLAPAFFGLILIAFAFPLARWIGRKAAAAYAIFVLLTAHYLYFSRFIREDLYSLVFTLGTIVAFQRFLETDRARWLLGSAACFAFAGVTKENAYMTGVLFVAYGLWCLVRTAPSPAGPEARRRRGGRLTRWTLARIAPVVSAGLLFLVIWAAMYTAFGKYPGRLAGDPQGRQVLDGPARHRADPGAVVVLLPAARRLRHRDRRRGALRVSPARLALRPSAPDGPRGASPLRRVRRSPRVEARHRRPRAARRARPVSSSRSCSPAGSGSRRRSPSSRPSSSSSRSGPSARSPSTPGPARKCPG